MSILNYDNSDHEKEHQVQEDQRTLKWRRSGKDRRSGVTGDVREEQRSFKGRRTRWLEILSSIIYPRGSK